MSGEANTRGGASSRGESAAATTDVFYLQRLRKNEVGKVYALSWHSYKTREDRDRWAGRYRRQGDEVRSDAFAVPGDPFDADA